MPAICARLISDGRADRQGRRQRRAQHRLHLRLTHVPFPPRRAIPSILQGPPVSPARLAGTRPPCSVSSSLFFFSFMLAGRDSCGRGPRMSKRRKRASDASHPLAARSRDSPFLSRPQPPAPQHTPLCGDSRKTGAGMAIWHTLRRVCHFESSVLGLTFLRRGSGLCAPRLPTVLYPHSTGANGNGRAELKQHREATPCKLLRETV